MAYFGNWCLPNVAIHFSNNLRLTRTTWLQTEFDLQNDDVSVFSSYPICYVNKMEFFLNEKTWLCNFNFYLSGETEREKNGDNVWMSIAFSVELRMIPIGPRYWFEMNVTKFQRQRILFHNQLFQRRYSKQLARHYNGVISLFCYSSKEVFY